MSSIVQRSSAASALVTTSRREASHAKHVRSAVYTRCSITPQNNQLSSIERRNILIGVFLNPIVAATSLLSPLPAPAAAAADNIELPKGYLDTARSLVEALRDAVDTDLSGAPEREVRRKADPAKDLVRQFMTRWKDVPLVKDDVSYTQLTGAIKELGEFYMKNGQRSRLPDDIGQALLARLEAAENALPPEIEKKSIFPF
jgi:Photosystem II Pbs27